MCEGLKQNMHRYIIKAQLERALDKSIVRSQSEWKDRVSRRDRLEDGQHLLVY